MVSQTHSGQINAAKHLRDTIALQPCLILQLMVSERGRIRVGKKQLRTTKECRKRSPGKESLGLSDKKEIMDASYQSAKIKRIYF